MTWLELVGSLVALLGAALTAASAIGLHRFDDPAVRLHIAAKASSAGILVVLVGLGLRAGSPAVALELALTGLFLVLTVPIATHALAAARLAPPDGADDGPTTDAAGPEHAGRPDADEDHQ